jgi:hypothetical protein
MKPQNIGIICTGQVGSLLAHFAFKNKRMSWIIAWNEKELKILY